MKRKIKGARGAGGAGEASGAGGAINHQQLTMNDQQLTTNWVQALRVY